MAIHPVPLRRALARILVLAALSLAGGPAPAGPDPAPREFGPGAWTSFLQCVEFLEHWTGRSLPDWVVHSVPIHYSARRPLYNRNGDPLQDPAGNPVYLEAPATGRVFLPPAWRLRGRTKLPLVLYAHGTMLERGEVPSRFGGGEWFLAAAAALYYGFAVAMPDQPGMGPDSPVYHTFCHARALTLASLDALPAVERLPRTDPYLARHGYDWDGRLFVLGYSEGGYTALAVVRELEARNGGRLGRFTLAGSACMAGPFDLSGTCRAEMIDPARKLAHSFFLPYIMLSYRGLYGDLLDPARAFAPVLLERREDGDLRQWADGSASGLVLDERIARRLGVPDGTVTGRQMLNPDWVRDQLEDPAYATSAIHKILAENDLCRGGWRPTRPILFCQSPADRDVSLAHTTLTMAALAAEIRKDGGDPDRLLAFRPLGGPGAGISHAAGALLAIPAAFEWFYRGMPAPWTSASLARREQRLMAASRRDAALRSAAASR